MTEREQGSGDIEILRRMIAYVREEAIRLRIMDVVLLLEHAQEAVTAFAPCASRDPGRVDAVRGADRVGH